MDEFDTDGWPGHIREGLAKMATTGGILKDGGKAYAMVISPQAFKLLTGTTPEELVKRLAAEMVSVLRPARLRRQLEFSVGVSGESLDDCEQQALKQARDWFGDGWELSVHGHSQVAPSGPVRPGFAGVTIVVEATEHKPA